MSNLSVEQALQTAQACLAGGRLAEAEGICSQILAAFPEQAGALHLLAGAALLGGRGEEAMDLLQRTLAADPADAGAMVHLGELLVASGRGEEAAAVCERALALQPDFAEAHYWLGRIRREAGRLDEAIPHLARAAAVAPGWVAAHKEWAKALLSRQRLEEGRQVLARALTLDPNDADLHNDLAAVIVAFNQHAQAHQHLARAVQLDPGNAIAVNNLGFTLQKLGRMGEARACFERALELRPGYGAACLNLGALFRAVGQPERALEFTRRAVAAEPGSVRNGSDLVLAAYYHPGLSREEVGAELRGWNVRYAVAWKSRWRPHTNDRDPERRLRVGYVSPDFCGHVVSRFLVPLLEHHDPAQVEVYAYASVAVPDGVTARLRRSVRVWRDVLSRTDGEVAELVRADGMDILVDLSSHTAGHRLLSFACKPAPVQVSWLGFAGSTGLEAMDYRFTDPVMDPPGADEGWSSETPVRLPDAWCCFDPLHETGPAAPLPALRNGFVTFGSLNNFAKVNAPTLRRWARALRAVAGSRLLLHAPEGEAREFVRGVLAEEGIGAERVEFAGWQEGRDYLRTYDRIDVGLDPFPFNGMTTTCDALWRGVPVLSLPGELPAARAGGSLMRTAGLEAWVARDEEDYARKARELTANPARMQRLRAGLWRRMQESPLMDGGRFARNVEGAYRGMWRRWVERGGG